MVSGDLNPFQYCNNVKPINDSLVPHNPEGSIHNQMKQGQSSKDTPLLKGKEKMEEEIVVKEIPKLINQTTSTKGKEKVNKNNIFSEEEKEESTKAVSRYLKETQEAKEYSTKDVQRYTKEAHYQKINKMMQNFDKQCKIKQQGVGGYSLSMMDLPLSPKSFGKPPNLPHRYNDNFVRASTSSAMDEEDNEILNWLSNHE